MQMKEYKQADIDEILEVADASRYDEEELQKILDIVVVTTLEVTAPSNLVIDFEDYETITSYLENVIESVKDNDLKTELNQKKNNYIRIANLITSLDKEQGIIVGDYDRNVWRVAYTLKTIHLAEIEDKYNLPFTYEKDLLENIQDENINHFTETYERIYKSYIEGEANRMFLKFLSEYTQIDNFKPLMNKFKIDTDLIDLVQAEADRVEALLLEKMQAETDDIENFTWTVVGKYKPIFSVPNLDSIKLKKADYQEIRDRYIDISLNELLITMNIIKKHFYQAIRGYYSDD